LKANNGNYVTMKPNGSLVATASSVGDTEQFIFNLVNRPQLVLRSDYGYLASRGRDIVTAANDSYDVFTVSVKDGKYVFKGVNGKYFRTDSDGSVSTTGDEPEYYTIQLLAHSRLAIRNANGAFMKAENSGNWKATGGNPNDNDCLFEF